MGTERLACTIDTDKVTTIRFAADSTLFFVLGNRLAHDASITITTQDVLAGTAEPNYALVEQYAHLAELDAPAADVLAGSVAFNEAHAEAYAHTSELEASSMEMLAGVSDLAYLILVRLSQLVELEATIQSRMAHMCNVESAIANMIAETSKLEAAVQRREAQLSSLRATVTSRLAITSTLNPSLVTVIPYSASSYSHVMVNGSSTLVDLMNSRTWTKTGSPTFNASASLGFTRTISAPSVGGFSDSNYFTSSSFNFADTNTSIIITLVLTNGNGGFTTANIGWWRIAGVNWNFNGVPYSGTAPSNYAVPWVISFGYTGGTYYMKTNKSTVTSGSGSGVSSSISAQYIGRWNTGGFASNATIYEMRMIATTCSAAILDSLHNSIMG